MSLTASRIENSNISLDIFIGTFSVKNFNGEIRNYNKNEQLFVCFFVRVVIILHRIIRLNWLDDAPKR